MVMNYLVKVLNACRGMWKDLNIDFKESRRLTWGYAISLRF